MPETLVRHPEQSVSLYDYFTSLIRERETRYEQRFTALRDAAEIASAGIARQMLDHDLLDKHEHANSALALESQVAALRDLISATDKRAEMALGSLREQFNLSLASQDRAITKAEDANGKRFEAVNEFRSTLGDQQRNLMPRTEVEVMMRNMNEKIEAQNSTIKIQNDRIIVLAANREGTATGMHSGWTASAAVVGWLLALFSMFGKFGK